MNETCPTVKVKASNAQGFVVINESDFDAKVHVRFDAPDVVEPEAEDVAKRRGRPPGKSKE